MKKLGNKGITGDHLIGYQTDKGNKANSVLKKRLFSIPEAAEYLALSPWTIRELIWKGALPKVQPNRRILLDIRDLDTFIERNKIRETT